MKKEPLSDEEYAKLRASIDKNMQEAREFEAKYGKEMDELLGTNDDKEAKVSK